MKISKTNQRKIEIFMVILSIIVSLLFIGRFFSVFTIVNDVGYVFEKNYTYNGYNILSKSSFDFVDTDIEDSCGGRTVEKNMINDFSINLRGLTVPGSGCGLRNIYHAKRTFLLTKNMEISTNTLETLEFDVNAQRSVGCGNCNCYPGIAEVYLHDGTNGIRIYQPSINNANNHVKIYKNDGKFYNSLGSGVDNLLNINGNYSLLIYATIPPPTQCGNSGVSADTSITLSNLVLKKNETNIVTPPPESCPSGTVKCADGTCKVSCTTISSHKECSSNSCISVNGAGSDTCSTDLQCTDRVCLLGQTKCPDGVCRENCKESPQINYFALFLILSIPLIIVVGLITILLKKIKRKV